MMQEYLSKIPKVNHLLESVQGMELVEQYSHLEVVETIQGVTAEIRTELLKGAGGSSFNPERLTIEHILAQVEERLLAGTLALLAPAVNATGIVLHTNLGRSLLSTSALQAMTAVAANYSTLEINRESGERGSRYDHVQGLLQELTGAEDSIVVNNNAAAVLLTLSSLAAEQEVIIARGELVEIGGSFRIPDVMKQSKARLVEVGATNKVYPAEFEEAITAETALLLKVHTSNYRIIGFTRTIELAEMVKLGQKYQIPVVEDLGSGSLVDLTPYGLSYEPRVQDSILAGADLVTFSGDKLLGGPQAGIIVGKKRYIEQLKKHPLNRALRVDKFTLSALEATLREYRNPPRARKEIPTLRMLTTSKRILRERAERLLSGLKEVLPLQCKTGIKEEVSRVGGGAFPLDQLPTYVVEIRPDGSSEQELARKLRNNNPSIFTRCNHGKVLFDVRTVREQDIMLIIEAVNKCFQKHEQESHD